MAKAVGEINEDMAYLGKDLGRAKDEAGTNGAFLSSTKTKEHTLASEVYKVRERSEGGKAYQRADVNRSKATTGRDMVEAKRLHNRLE